MHIGKYTGYLISKYLILIECTHFSDCVSCRLHGWATMNNNYSYLTR